MLTENKIFLSAIFVDPQFRIFFRTEDLVLETRNALCELGVKMNNTIKQKSGSESDSSAVSGILPCGILSDEEVKFDQLEHAEKRLKKDNLPVKTL